MQEAFTNKLSESNQLYSKTTKNRTREKIIDLPVKAESHMEA